MKVLKVFLLFSTVAFFSFLGGIVFQMYSTGFVIHAKENHYFPEIRTKALHIVDDQNKIRASFYLGIHDCPNLVLYDKNETNRFNFGLAPPGALAGFRVAWPLVGHVHFSVTTHFPESFGLSREERYPPLCLLVPRLRPHLRVTV